MTLTRMMLLAALLVALAPLGTAFAQTATQNLPISGGTFTGDIGGTINAIVKPQNTAGTVQTRGFLNITDLDIETRRDSSGNFLFPNSTSNNNTASTNINIAPTTIGISVPTTPFSSGVGGSVSITAGDSRSDGSPGVLDGGVAGPDGRWDDPGQTSILNNATTNGFNVSLNSPINATANVSGAINASIPNNITIPNVVDTSILNADLVLKNSSTISVNFQPVQSLSLQNLSISSAIPIALNGPLSGGFPDGAHPVPGANMTLNLSTGGGGLVATTISGNLLADIQGTVNGNIDLRADLSLIGLIDFGVDFNDVVDGELSDGVVSLIDLNEDIALDDISLPFSIQVIHNASMNLDYDDVIAQIASGTFGLTVPIEMLEQDIELDIPETSFQIQEQTFNADVGLFTNGSVILHNLEATLGGTIVLDLDADLALSATMLASALGNNAINVVPEPGSVVLAVIGSVALIGIAVRRRRK